MTAAVATRSPLRRARTTPPGTGELHRALEDARDRALLSEYCSAHACTPDQVSRDGIRLDISMVFDLMRSRGYAVSAPRRAAHQPNRSSTTWLVDIQLPSGEALVMGFYTPNTP